MNATLSATLSALAEPNRFRIVELLRDRPRSVNEIVEQLRLKQSLVSKHLRALSHAGLVQVQPIAQQRIYKLQAQPLKELDTWLDSFSQVWDERLDEFDMYLQVMKEEKKDHDGSQ